MHGHNYVAYLTAWAERLDSCGRIVDFSVLKSKVGGWIEKNWDHGFIYWGKDKAVADALVAFQRIEVDQKQYALDTNPTAENLAAYLLKVVGPMVLEGTGVQLTEVSVWETENCYAQAVLGE